MYAGSEGVGVVEELGPGTTSRLSKGQRLVAGDWGLTSWQEYAAIDEKFLVRSVVIPFWLFLIAFSNLVEI